MESNTTISHDPAELGELERSTLQLVWLHGTKTSGISAEQIREELGRPLKDSTIRTVLRRLEEKGYLTHKIEGRTYLYSPAEARQGGGWTRSEADHRLVLRWISGSAAGGYGGFQRSR